MWFLLIIGSNVKVIDVLTFAKWFLCFIVLLLTLTGCEGDRG